MPEVSNGVSNADASEFVPGRTAVANPAGGAEGMSMLVAALARGPSEGEDPSSKKRRIEGFAPERHQSRTERYSMFDDPEDFHWDDEEPEDHEMPALVGGEDDIEAGWYEDHAIPIEVLQERAGMALKDAEQRAEAQAGWADFIKTKTFDRSRQGMVFKKGKKGVGYYADNGGRQDEQHERDSLILATSYRRLC